MTDLDLIDRLSEAQVCALTLYGEARNQGIEGRIGVANTIRNRVRAKRAKQFGVSARDVCLKPWQYSCWLPAGGAENYGLVLDAARLVSRGELGGPMLTECLWIAGGLLTDVILDNVKGATHYLTAEALALRAPVWTVGLEPVAHIHDHVFFAGVW